MDQPLPYHLRLLAALTYFTDIPLPLLSRSINEPIIAQINQFARPDLSTCQWLPP